MVDRKDYSYRRRSVERLQYLADPETSWEAKLPRLIDSLQADVSDEERIQAGLQLQRMAELADRYEDMRNS